MTEVNLEGINRHVDFRVEELKRERDRQEHRHVMTIEVAFDPFLMILADFEEHARVLCSVAAKRLARERDTLPKHYRFNATVESCRFEKDAIDTLREIDKQLLKKIHNEMEQQVFIHPHLGGLRTLIHNFFDAYSIPEKDGWLIMQPTKENIE